MLNILEFQLGNLLDEFNKKQNELNGFMIKLTEKILNMEIKWKLTGNQLKDIFISKVQLIEKLKLKNKAIKLLKSVQKLKLENLHKKSSNRKFNWRLFAQKQKNNKIKRNKKHTTENHRFQCSAQKDCFVLTTNHLTCFIRVFLQSTHYCTKH